MYLLLGIVVVFVARASTWLVGNILDAIVLVVGFWEVYG